MGRQGCTPVVRRTGNRFSALAYASRAGPQDARTFVIHRTQTAFAARVGRTGEAIAEFTTPRG
jgi:hypothetical protein